MWRTIAVVTATLASAAAPAADFAAVKPFLDAHCNRCHAGDNPKGGFRLKGVGWNPADPDALRTFDRAFVRLAAGDMPPADAQPPSPAARAAAVRGLETALADADRTRRVTAGGRGTARRLNRTEYENTVRDLLGIDLDLKHQFPEDGRPGVFDTEAAGLSVSAAHVERYLDAATRAAEAAFPDRPRPPAKTWKGTLRPANVRNPQSADYRFMTGQRELPDGTIVLFNSLRQNLVADQFHAPEEGRYRVRVTASAVQSGGKPLALGVFAGSFASSNPQSELAGHFEVQPERRTAIEFETWLPVKGTVKPVPAGLGYREIPFNGPYTGPGVAVHEIEIDGPLGGGEQSRIQKELFGPREMKSLKPADARPALARFLPKAFRRPVTAAEEEVYARIVAERVAAGEPFPAAFRAAVRAVLCSTEFLFLRPRGDRLTPHELAARLSYFLWSSCPDDALTTAAARGELSTPAGLRIQVDRMLADPKARRFTENFVGQWLGLRQIDATTPDRKLYPEFDDHLQESMVRETELFFEEMLRADLPARDLVHSDWAVLNGRLARHYGVPGVDGLAFCKVALPPGSHRGGVLTHASVLKVTANGTTTSPVVRGNWVLNTLLGRPVPGPPPAVPAIEPDTRGATTIRAQLEKHRASASCAGCHDRIDPPGLALESYDVLGAYRTYYRATAGGPKVNYTVDCRPVGHHRGPAVDSSGELADGEAFRDLDGLKTLLLRDERAVAECVAGKLLTYATGAAPQPADRPALRAAVDAAGAKRFGLRALLHAVVQSEPFHLR